MRGDRMRDGLWVVVTDHFVAGFVVRHGRVAAPWCAPILRPRFDVWRRRARWLGP